MLCYHRIYKNKKTTFAFVSEKEQIFQLTCLNYVARKVN